MCADLTLAAGGICPDWFQGGTCRTQTASGFVWQTVSGCPGSPSSPIEQPRQSDYYYYYGKMSVCKSV